MPLIINKKSTYHLQDRCSKKQRPANESLAGVVAGLWEKPIFITGQGKVMLNLSKEVLKSQEK
jgi:hypothetical protein